VIAGPLDVGHGDPADHPVPDRRDHVRVPQGGDVTPALEARLDLVDAAGDVDREHQLEIDGQLLGAGREAGNADQADEEPQARQIRHAHDGCPR
jgi:hypothetical protein